jgi:hypothetical protein
MENADPTSEAVNHLHARVEALLDTNHPEEKVVQILSNDGVAPHYVELLINNIKNDRSDRKSFRASMIMGSCYIVVGMLINLLSYRFATKMNTTGFYLFWGIVVFGIVTIIRGFMLYRK